MDRNFFLALALSFAVLSLWTFLKAPDAKQAVEKSPTITLEPRADSHRDDGRASLLSPTEAPSSQQSRRGDRNDSSELLPEQRIELDNALYRSSWSNIGGGLLQWDLHQYRDASLEDEPPIPMVTTHIGEPVALSTPLLGLGFGDMSDVRYDVTRDDSRGIDFRYERDGVEIRKSFRFRPDSYEVDFTFEIENGGNRHVRPTFAVRWPVQGRKLRDYQELSLVVRHDGDLQQERIGTGSGFLGFGGPLKETKEYLHNVSWAGSQMRYFLAVLIPEQAREASARFTPLAQGTLGICDLAFQSVDIPPGQSASRNFKLYIGPKETKRLDAAGAHLDEAIAKGWFPPLTHFFIWLLDAAHNAIPNYGLAIVALTLLVRILMVPILAKQMKSMKRMGELQPKIKAIQEQYSDDKQKQSAEMMKFYKESGFNPLGGCLPMLLQLPVFIGLYYALQGAIELRQAPFFAWITDLSAPEVLFTIPGMELPVRVLPLLMGGSMVIQTRMTPTTMDPAQARMMNTMMPIVFTLMFYQFASGLVLYWLVSNVLGILQQWYTNRSKPAS